MSLGWLLTIFRTVPKIVHWIYLPSFLARSIWSYSFVHSSPPCLLMRGERVRKEEKKDSQRTSATQSVCLEHLFWLSGWSDLLCSSLFSLRTHTRLMWKLSQESVRELGTTLGGYYYLTRRRTYNLLRTDSEYLSVSDIVVVYLRGVRFIKQVHVQQPTMVVKHFAIKWPNLICFKVRCI